MTNLRKMVLLQENVVYILLLLTRDCIVYFIPLFSKLVRKDIKCDYKNLIRNRDPFTCQLYALISLFDRIISGAQKCPNSGR